MQIACMLKARNQGLLFAYRVCVQGMLKKSHCVIALDTVASIKQT